MIKNLLLISIVIMTLLTSVAFFSAPNTTDTISYNLDPNRIMPLVDDDPFAAMAYGGEPREERGIEYRRWLANGLKVSVRGGSGSGTIVYHDPQTGWAYVQSCGHLWKGNLSAAEASRQGVTCAVETWYHNELKLKQSRKYQAEVLYYSNRDGQDVSLLRFKPDWAPNYLPIAPKDYNVPMNARLHSVGCDQGREVAHYNVRYIGTRLLSNGYRDMVTTENSPRPGRSGGGLSTDEFYVGICWGTSSYSGEGNGFFTPLKTVREYNERNGYGWLNEVGYGIARLIPIIDRNEPQGDYPPDYIPLPKGRQ